MVFLFLIAWIAIQQPKVQNFIVDKVTSTLSETLQTKVEIGRVDLDFFKTFVIEGIYVEDQQQDTLLYANRLTASIGLFSLTGQEIHLSEVALEDSRIKIDRNAQDSTFNFQFLVDAFAPTDTVTVVDTTAAAPWGIDIDVVRIDDAALTFRDEVIASNLETNIHRFKTTINSLDLEKQAVHIDEIALSKSGVDYTIFESEKIKEAVAETMTPKDSTTMIVDTTKLVFPDVGWAVKIDNINFLDNYVNYSDSNYDTLSGVLDANHLFLSDLNISIENVNIEKDHITTRIDNFTFKEKNGFNLQHFSVDLEASPELIAVQNLDLKTPESQIKNNTNLYFEEFNDLLYFMDKVELDINFTDSYLAFSDINFLAPQLQDIKEINTQLDEKFSINGVIQGKVNDIKKMTVDAKIGQLVQLNVDGQFQGLPDVNDLVFDLNIKEISTSYRGLNKLTNNIGLPPGLANLGSFTFSGNFKGKQENFRGNNLQLNTSAYTGFRGNLAAKGLPNIDRATFKLDIQELRTQSEDLVGFMPDNQVPPQLDSLGKIQYVGTFDGTTTDFVLTGDLTTDIGEMETDFHADFTPDYSNATYQGEVNLIDFNLGKMLADEENIGKVSMTATADGSGMTPDDISTELSAVVQSFVFQKYEYNDFAVNGALDKMQFTGKAKIDDENIALDFDGLVNLNDSIPDLKFTLLVDTVNLKNLNLSPIDYGVSAKIVSDLKGNSADNLKGDLAIQDLYFSTEAETFYADTMTLKAQRTSAKERKLTFNSDILNFRLEGDYNTADFPILLTNFMNDFFPVDNFMSSKDTPTELALEPRKQKNLPDQNFEFEFGIRDPIPLTRLFVPELEQMDTAYLVGKFDSSKKFMEIKSSLPELVYSGMKIENINLNSDGTTKKFTNQLNLINSEISSTMLLPFIGLTADMYDDSLFLSVNIQGDTSMQKLRLATVVSEENSQFKVVLDDKFVVNNEQWDVATDNAIYYAENLLNINNLSLSKDNQEFRIASDDKANDEDLAPISVSFKDFRLSEVSKLLQLEDAFYEGKINGGVVVKDVFKNLHYLVDMDVSDIVLNDDAVGDLSIAAEQKPGSPQIDILAQLKGANNNFKVDGHYNIEANNFDIDANISGIELRIADPFMVGLMDESEGTISGKFDIAGTPEAPSVIGELNLNNASTNVEMLQSRYQIEQHTIKVNNEAVQFGNMILVDDNGNKATFGGQIRHENFIDFILDLNFSTDNFQVLNTTAADNELYYGTLFISTYVTIKGDMLEPKIEVVRAKTLPNSILHVQPLSLETGGVSQEDYIIFANPYTFIPEDTTLTLDDLYNVNPAGVDMLLNLELTRDAELQIIIDPATGDKLVVRGNADLTVAMNPAGDVSITGNYRVHDGNYSLNYQGILKKEFAIDEGSNILFPGDPLKARFDITAVYTAQTTTYELIKAELPPSPEGEESPEEYASKRRSEIDVLLQVKGTMDEPQISFNILPQEEANSLLGNVLTRKLEQLRENETELNKQVFGLLLLGNFIAEQSSTGGGSLASTGSSVALSSVSSLLTNQLNKLADQYVKGVDLDFGVNSYQADYSDNTVTELQVGLSKQLLNDRLTIRIGGNLNLGDESGTGEQQNDLSNISSDFVLEYKLTKSGTYRLQAFRKEDFDAFNNQKNAKFGAGIIFQKSFGGTKENVERQKEVKAKKK